MRELLQAGRSEEEIEKETAVSDRTIRRWKLELERFGRIGKPPESRTGRHRVMGPDIEQALFEHVAAKPELSVDDMLWWLYDQYKLVVGTRTIRRAFERRKTSHKKFSSEARRDRPAALRQPQPQPQVQLQLEPEPELPHAPVHVEHVPDSTYQSPYAPVAPMSAPIVEHGGADIGPELARALGGLAAQGGNESIHPDLMGESAHVSEDEETLELQLQQIALQKRELELKLKMRRLQRGIPVDPAMRRSHDPDTSFLTDLDNSTAAAGADHSVDESAPSTLLGQRDSRSKNKIEEARRRTEERQERMLKDLEKRSRRREHLTAEWVQVHPSYITHYLLPLPFTC